MRDKNDINKELDELEDFQTLTEAYTEIAAVRMKKTRDKVLLNREYLVKLDSVFSDVRVSYAREVLKLGESSRYSQDKITFLAHNGKTVGVFLAANTGLYGDIINRTFDYFVQDLSQIDMEVTVIGKLGQSYFESSFPKHPYTFFSLSDRKIQPQELSAIIRHLVQYEEIRVYYPSYRSAATQKPSRYTISAETPLSEIQRKSKNLSHYLFEPSLKEVLVFFEKEIFASLLDQTIRDAQLAKFAARIMALDRAGENIKTELGKLKTLQIRGIHRERNKKQLESVIGKFV